MADEPLLTALSGPELMRLARRLAGARGVEWPGDDQLHEPPQGFEAKVTDRPGRQRVVWVTPFKNRGLLGIFVDDRLLAMADQGLADILRVQIAELPDLPFSALIVDDLFDEWLGAFLREERRRIYVWDGFRFREVFKGILQTKQLRHGRWENLHGPNAWRLEQTTGDIDLKGGNLTYRIRVEILEAVGSPRERVPPLDRFKSISSHEEVHHYRWNARLRRFDPVD